MLWWGLKVPETKFGGLHFWHPKNGSLKITHYCGQFFVAVARAGASRDALFFFVVSSGTYFACSSSCRAFAFRGCPRMFFVVVLGHAFVPALAGKAEGPRGYVNNVDFSSRGRRLREPVLSRMVLRSATFMFCSAGQAARFFNLAMQRPRAATPAICFSPRSPLLKRITGCISQ